MSYNGYVPLMKRYIAGLKNPPNVLEIGVDKGTTFIPLVVFLARTQKAFNILGVDILLREELRLTLANIDVMGDQHVMLLEKNSKGALPDLVNSNALFDLVLIDGDHNYHTVKEELAYLNKITKLTSLVVIDDYNGRWSDKDLWYSERSEYEDIKDATPRVKTEKHGVKPAVDEFLKENPEWVLTAPIKGEPVILVRKELQGVFDERPPQHGTFVDTTSRKGNDDEPESNTPTSE